MPRSLRFLGYSARRTEAPSDWVSFGVEEVCSAADHVAQRPDGWVERWDFNRACCHDTEAIALAAANGESGFRVLAYALVEAKLDEASNEIAITADSILIEGLSDLPAGPVPSGLVSLGYDVVCINRSHMDFDCSPLSCNGLAREIRVNRHCLVDDLDEAMRLAQRFDREQPEPGSYYVVQVLRAASS
jgi:hypothetical protein